MSSLTSASPWVETCRAVRMEGHVMRLFRRRKRAGAIRSADRQDLSHLRDFVASRPGVEAYLEPRTAVTETTVVLVAASGEWTRRRIDGPAAARAFAQKHAIPLYDAQALGYPQRMRDWTARQKPTP